MKEKTELEPIGCLGAAAFAGIIFGLATYEDASWEKSWLEHMTSTVGWFVLIAILVGLVLYLINNRDNE